ncbi:MAG TPA: LacI family DNA-binding transcriptional regulator [Streptosporangiaceae bacterium]|nr:LacI family DNA-binding transcriptional regulator [Streptosporangiaceae bacterium]
MSTVYEVAERAGVSIATVSRVINGSSLVNARTRERVLAAISELGFVPNRSAQSLSLRRTDIVGLVALDRGSDASDSEVSSPLFLDELIRAVEGVLRGTKYSLLLTLGHPGEEFEQRVWELSGKVDGLIFAEEVMPTARLAALAGRIPVVSVAGQRDTGADLVAVDNALGIRELAGHLLEDHGYRRVCFVAGPGDSPDARQRLAAFTQAVAEHPGCQLEPVLSGDFSEASGGAAARALLAEGAPPPVVACANDQMAIGVLRELQRHGVAVPSDVAVTGFDDVLISGLMSPTLTTVAQPLRQLGRFAVQRLLDRIATPGLPACTEILPTHLVVRESCGCQPNQTSQGR